ncbi:MAG: nucleotidyltransferase family protein [Proteobacteria bacterium]|nr:nucleotidyltransferase family protein [Pseudomonadota bacterium]
MACLKAGYAVGANDWYLAAGFVRNLIWDYLHSKKAATPLSDVDFVYFNAHDTSLQAEEELRERLIELMPDPAWQVRNQARMHIRNSHRAYRNSEDAIAHWPEVPTCVGAKLKDDGRIAIVAPYGLDENWTFDVRPNQGIPYPPELFARRVKEKNWMKIWPNLIIHWPKGAGLTDC